jgi:hypothetical protein
MLAQPRARGRIERAGRALGDVSVTALLVLMLPVVLVIGAPVVFLAWAIVAVAQRD